MTGKGDELRCYLRELNSELEKDFGRHLGDEELIRYVGGQLPEPEQETAQSHLVQCPACRAALQDVSDFIASTREAGEPSHDEEIARQYNAFWRRVRWEEAEGAKGAAGLHIAGFSLGLRATLAIAAGLILTVALTSTWALRVRRENQRLARQLQTASSRLPEPLRPAGSGDRQPPDPADAIKQQYEAQLAELRQPQLNTPIYDILSGELARRSGMKRKVAVIEIPASARWFSLILNGAGQPEYRSYRIEITNQKGILIWRGEGLKRGGDGNFVVTFERTFLSEGQYHLKIYNQANNRSRPVAEYIIALKISSS